MPSSIQRLTPILFNFTQKNYNIENTISLLNLYSDYYNLLKSIEFNEC